MKAMKRIRFKQQSVYKKVNYRWIFTITLVTFLISMFLSYFSLLFMDLVSMVGALFLLGFIIFVGIFFDLLGIAVSSANETPFHSMAANKVKGAKESIFVIRNASSVANLFNDVIGDIAGIISGSATSAIIIKLMIDSKGTELIFSILLGGLVAALTVGGKAFSKVIAFRHSNRIVFDIGLLLAFFRIKTK